MEVKQYGSCAGKTFPPTVDILPEMGYNGNTKEVNSMFDAQQSVLSKIITAIKVFFEKLLAKFGK